MNSISVAIFHTPIPSRRLGKRRDEDGSGQDDLQAADHPREREAPYREVMKANRRIVCSQRGLVVEWHRAHRDRAAAGRW